MLTNVFFPEAVTNIYLLRILIASLLGGVIGLERDIHGRAAGLRTNLLVSLGAAVFTIVSEAVASPLSGSAAIAGRAGDPGRIAAQIVTGIGFIGAGAVIKSGFSIRGLTTATCIWLSAAIGMSAGAGYFELAIVATTIGLFSLVVLNKFEKIFAKDSYRTLEITTTNASDIPEIVSLVERRDIKVVYLEKERNYLENRMTLKLTLRLSHRGVTDRLSHEVIKKLEESDIDLVAIRWRK